LSSHFPAAGLPLPPPPPLSLLPRGRVVATSVGHPVLPSLRLLSLARSPALTHAALRSLLHLNEHLPEVSHEAPRLLLQLKVLDLTFCPR
jgi:hypothetical protein